MNPLFITTRRAAGAITARSIVKPSTNDYEIVLASAATDKLMGITTEIDAASGEPCDVIRTGIAAVKLGGTVAAGDYITADSSGHGVKCAPTTGTVAQFIGKVEVAGVSGDIVDVWVAPGQITTP
jgi:hypothetical protein